MSNYKLIRRSTILSLSLALIMIAALMSSQPAQAQPGSMERVQPEKKQGKPIKEKKFFLQDFRRQNKN